MYPTIPTSTESLQTYCTTGPLLSEKELNYLKLLKEIPFHTFRRSCGFKGEFLKVLGQKIFDDFKFENGNWGNHDDGKQALKKIADTLPLYCIDGAKRREYLDIIWTGVGDFHWQWHFLYDGYRPGGK